jgi:hypothetical protein
MASVLTSLGRSNIVMMINVTIRPMIIQMVFIVLLIKNQTLENCQFRLDLLIDIIKAKEFAVDAVASVSLMF